MTSRLRRLKDTTTGTIATIGIGGYTQLEAMQHSYDIAQEYVADKTTGVLNSLAYGVGKLFYGILPGKQDEISAAHLVKGGAVEPYIQMLDNAEGTFLVVGSLAATRGLDNILRGEEESEPFKPRKAATSGLSVAGTAEGIRTLESIHLPHAPLQNLEETATTGLQQFADTIATHPYETLAAATAGALWYTGRKAIQKVRNGAGHSIAALNYKK